MKTPTGLLLIAAAIACTFSISSAFAKTAKECTAEWRADKAGMQARGTTEKAYVEQCKGGTEPTAAAPAPKPAEAAPAAPRQSTAIGSKTAKECTAEWRADKAGMKARGVTERAYVEQCRAGGSSPGATASEPKPTAAAPPPAPSRPAPTATEAAPSPAPQRPAPTTTAAPTPAPTPAQQQPAAARGSATLEAGQFADEASAKGRCPTDTVVWVNLPSKVYHFAGTKNYGTTKRGAYMCEKEAIAAEDRASKTETHP
jgi:hypothetical protein